MLQNQNYEAFLLTVSLHSLRISPYFTVEILVWSFKFFKDFFFHHDVGCHDNKEEEKTFLYLFDKSISIIGLYTKLASVRVLHIPHCEGPLCALIKAEHSSKLYWTDLKIIWHYILYYILFDYDPWPRLFKSYWSIQSIWSVYIMKF